MNSTILLWTPGVGEIILILAIVLLLFGAKRIPELMKGIGKGIREFKKGASGEDADESGKVIPEKKD